MMQHDYLGLRIYCTHPIDNMFFLDCQVCNVTCKKCTIYVLTGGAQFPTEE